MRDLKFRVFIGGQMIVVDESSSYTLTFGNARPSLAMFSNGGEFVCDSTVDEVMQYTGLHDANGVEIYEGDIVKWDDASKGKYWRVAQVVWQEKGQWGYKIIPSQCVNCFQNTSREKIFSMGNFIYTPDPSQYGNVLEVIGNIHENPDLVNT